jgi:hypothetical protein
MKRMFGYILAGIGAVAAIVGAVHVVQGESDKIVFKGVKALYIGLAGVAAFVLGLVTARD